MENKIAGFSLLGAMASIAVVGVLILGILEIVKMTTSISAMANTHLQIDDQVFQVRAVLRSTTACSLNLAGLAIDSTTQTPVTDIRYLAADQTSLTNSSALASTSGGLRLGSLSISRDPNIPNVAILALPFESKLPGLSHILRKVQLDVQTDASNKIVKCSSDRIDGNLNGETLDLTKSNLKSCRPKGVAIYSEGYPRGSLTAEQLKTSIRNALNAICDVIVYPTSDLDSPVVLTSNPFPGNNGKPPSITGAYGFEYINSNPTMFIDMDEDNKTTKTFRAGKYFSNLKSSQDCRATPEFPSGAGLITRSGVTGPDGSWSDRKEVCLDGVWIIPVGGGGLNGTPANG